MLLGRHCAGEKGRHSSTVSLRCQCDCCACHTCLLLPAAMHSSQAVLASIASEQMLLCKVHKPITNSAPQAEERHRPGVAAACPGTARPDLTSSSVACKLNSLTRAVVPCAASRLSR